MNNQKNLKTSEKPYINPAVITRETRDGALIIVNSDNGCSLAINKTGKIIWSLLSQNKSIEEITSHLSSSFQNVPETLELEVTNLIALLKKEGYIGYEIS